MISINNKIISFLSVQSFLCSHLQTVSGSPFSTAERNNFVFQVENASWEIKLDWEYLHCYLIKAPYFWMGFCETWASMTGQVRHLCPFDHNIIWNNLKSELLVDFLISDTNAVILNKDMQCIHSYSCKYVNSLNGYVIIFIITNHIK